MRRYSRRSILRGAACAAGAALAGRILNPQLLMAQSRALGTGKNFVVINLYGGADGLALAPYYSGPIYSTLQNLRPTVHIPAASVLQIAAQNGVTSKVGLHPSFQSLVSTAGQNIKIIQRYGIPGDPDRSHDFCQLLYSLGTTGVSDGNKGFLARLMDTQNWDSFQYWALSSSSQVDFNTEKNPPIVVDSLSEFDFNQLYNEGESDRDLAAEVRKMLLERRTPASAAGSLYKRQAIALHDSITTVRRDIATMTVGSNAAGNYSDVGIGSYLRDAARILKAKVTVPSLNLSAKDSIVYLGMGGYDSHSDQGGVDATGSLSLTVNFKTLGDNLAVFVQDLKNIGAWNDTVILVISEFGRTTRENGGDGDVAVGTDHGWGTNTIVLGGGIPAGVIGNAPTQQEILEEDRNALIAEIDFRDVYSEIVSWLGVDPYSIFTEAGYTRSPLGIFS